MALSASSNLEIFLRLRDEATAGVRNLGRELGNLGGVAKLSAGELRTVGTVIGVAGAGLIAMAVLAARAADTQGRLGQRVNDLRGNLNQLAQTIGTAVLPIMLKFLELANATLEVINKLPAPLLQVGGGLALIGGGLLTVLGSMALFISIMKELNAILKINIVLQTISKALQGPAGIIQVAAAVGAGVAIVATVGALSGSFQGGTNQVPGPPGQARLVVAHGGESIGTGGGGDTIVLSGIFMGNEREAQRLADMIQDRQRRKRRTTTDGSVA